MKLVQFVTFWELGLVTVDIDGFWKLIEQARNLSASDLSQQIDSLEWWLYAASEAELNDFDNIFHLEIFPQTLKYPLAFALGAIFKDLNWDERTFDKLITGLILQGQESFELIVGNHDELANLTFVVPKISISELLETVMPLRSDNKSLSSQGKHIFPDEPETVAEMEQFIFFELPRIFPKLMLASRNMRENQWHPSDRQLMHNLLDRGCELSSARKIDYFFFANNLASANKIVEELERIGHSVQYFEKEDGRYRIESNEIASPLEVTRKTDLLVELCASVKNATYDGWGTSV